VRQAKFSISCRLPGKVYCFLEHLKILINDNMGTKKYKIIVLIAMIVLPLVALLLLVVMFKLEPMVSPVSPPQQSGNNVEAEWERVWAQVMDDDTKEDTATPIERDICKQGLIEPRGDTWFMRHFKSFPLPDEMVQRIFVAAATSGDPIQRQSLLEPLLQNPDALIRYRAHLEIARSIMRKNQVNSVIEAFQAIQAALAVSLEKEQVKTDAYFLMGLYYLHQSKVSKAKYIIYKSIQLDPCFFDARSTYVETLLKSFAMTPRIGKTYPACLKVVLELIDNLYFIGSELVEDQRLYIEMANRLAQRPQNSLPYFMALGFVQFKASDFAKARKNLRTALNLNTQLPKQCSLRIREKASELLSLIDKSIKL